MPKSVVTLAPEANVIKLLFARLHLTQNHRKHSTTIENYYKKVLLTLTTEAIVLKPLWHNYTCSGVTLLKIMGHLPLMLKTTSKVLNIDTNGQC